MNKSEYEQIEKDLKRIRKEIRKTNLSCPNFSKEQMKTMDCFKSIDGYIGEFQRKYLDKK